MSASDGSVGSTTKIVDHGPASARWNVVILGDGYRATEIATYHSQVQDLVDTLYATPPFDELWCGINVFRVDVISTDSGADDPAACGGTGGTARTYFDATFCGDGSIQRLLTVNNATALSVAQSTVPESHFTMVLVNSATYGGSGGAVATVSSHPSAVEIALHEMGDTAFGLADEYEYYAGCGTGEAGHDSFGGGEPAEPNVTKDANRATNKWRALIVAGTPMPTTANADCTKCDSQASPVAAATVGAFEGSRYFHCGLYRGEFDCRMRALNNSYCAVCQRAIRNTIQPFLPAESLSLTTPSITFQDVPEGLGGIGVTTYRAIVWEVVSCTNKTLRIVSGPGASFGLPFGNLITLPPSKIGPIGYARLWLSYTSAAANSSVTGSVTVQCDETGEVWQINISANTVARLRTAVVLVLDHSGSMAEDAGDNISKVAKLREAADSFVSTMFDDHALAIVRFDDTAQELMPLTVAGVPATGAGRQAAIGFIDGSSLDPAGATSIGGGVAQGEQSLAAGQAVANPQYDSLATLVLTDGMENTAPMLSDVGSSITARTFAVGLGLPSNISVAALNTLTQGHGGYLLVTGAITSDQSTRLAKYFLQVLAGITNANVVIDPSGELSGSIQHRLPFSINEADFGMDVVLLCPLPAALEFELEAPDGSRITPGTAAGPGAGRFVIARHEAFYRMSLPALPANAPGSHVGTWHAVLSLPNKGKRLVTTAKRSESRDMANDRIIRRQALPYDLLVHAYSNLTFGATLVQQSYEPGALVTLRATLREYDVPVDGRANVWAEVTWPTGGLRLIPFTKADPGEFSASFQADSPGLYAVRIRAYGETFRGAPFTREQTRSAAVWPGGDRHPDTQSNAEQFCALLECLLRSKAFDAISGMSVKDLGVNMRAFEQCIRQHCHQSIAASVERNVRR